MLEHIDGASLWSVLPPGVVIKGSGSAVFTSIIRDVTFEDVPSYFRPGILFQGKVITQLSAVVELCYQFHIFKWSLLEAMYSCGILVSNELTLSRQLWCSAAVICVLSFPDKGGGPRLLPRCP